MANETNLDENPKPRARVQHSPEFRKKLQDRQDALDKERGKVRTPQPEPAKE